MAAQRPSGAGPSQSLRSHAGGIDCYAVIAFNAQCVPASRFTAARKPGMASTLRRACGTRGMRENKDNVADAIVGRTEKSFPPR